MSNSKGKITIYKHPLEIKYITNHYTTDELSGHRSIFGYIENGESITILVEDDGVWHSCLSFNRYWLKDLKATLALLERKP